VRGTGRKQQFQVECGGYFFTLGIVKLSKKVIYDLGKNSSVHAQRHGQSDSSSSSDDGDDDFARPGEQTMIRGRCTVD
jgi:hypothetical protein